MVQDQEGDVIISGTLCGIPLGKQHPEGTHERSRRAIRDVGFRCFPLLIANDKIAKECNRGQQYS
eukprot:11543894-Prorocentrum_lima.AAC.1